MDGNLFHRINYASNVDVADFIKTKINNKIFSGYVLFTDSTQLPGGQTTGVVSFESANGTGVVYLEFRLQDLRYYGYFLQQQNTITWKQYSFL